MTTGSTSSYIRSNRKAPAPAPESAYVRYLRAAMAHAGLKAEHIVDLTDDDLPVSKTTMSLILSGTQDPRTITNRTHAALAKILNVPMASLIEHAGYDLYNGREIPPEQAVAELAAIEVPRVQCLADVVVMPLHEVDLLMKLLHAHRRAMAGGS